MNDWQCTPKDISEFVGFVYKIWNNIDNKYYIGQKKFWFKRKLKPLKGKKRFRHRIIESDWKTYWGSNKELLSDIERLGKKNFTRMMYEWCESKAEMNYIETKMQFDHDVLRDKKSYNGMINCRISKNQLKS